MLKKVGFLFLIVLVAVLLRPQLFFEKAATETLADFSNSSKLENISRGDNNTTDYAGQDHSRYRLVGADYRQIIEKTVAEEVGKGRQPRIQRSLTVSLSPSFSKIPWPIQ